MQHETQGRKEVGEAVLSAALCALATELCRWLIDELKERTRRRRERSEDPADAA